MLVALVISALGGVFALLWFKLPTWAPAWVVEHSPWVDPIMRAVEAEQVLPKSQRIMNQAGQRLINMGEAARPGLLRALESKSRATREYALNVLLVSVDERLTVPLVRLLTMEARELEAQARKSGGVDLIAHQRNRFEPIYAALMKQSHAEVVNAILPLPPRSDLEAAVIFELAGKLADDRLIPTLAKILREPPGSWNELVGPVYGGRPVMAADALLHSPVPAAISELLPAFDDESVDVRRVVVSAVRSLFRPVPPELALAMCRRLSDVDADVRQTAAKAMVFIDVPEAEAGLISMSQRDDAKDRKAAIFGLSSNHTTQRGIDRLGECLAGDVDENVRLAAIEALAKTGNRKVVPLLLRALVNGTPPVCRQTCFVLSSTTWVKEPQTQEALLLAMDDPDDPTSEWAEKTLLRQPMTPEFKSRLKLAIERQKPRRSQ